MDVKTIGAFGISFSRGLDQTWFNLNRVGSGFTIDFYQFVEDEDSDEDDEVIDVRLEIPEELDEKILAEAFEKGRLEEWDLQYTDKADAVPTDLNWTIDVDDNDGADMLLISGNGKLPPPELMNSVLAAVRLGEDRFARCFRQFC
ncbi:MAG: hypothetical protein IKN76_00735 [Oscillospiraceae bacterium]|nr:hypothetical protein [Oscillospiraceae bacterium]